MIYFLRLMVDPAEPNPRINRIVHRVALAALAGVIAGWFWEPAFGTNSEFQAAGLGLFTFAFIIGFSIEIFFSLWQDIRPNLKHRHHQTWQLKSSEPASPSRWNLRPEICNRRPDDVLDGPGAGRQHDEAVEAEGRA